MSRALSAFTNARRKRASSVAGFSTAVKQATQAIAKGQPKAPVRSLEEMVQEILELVRGLAQGRQEAVIHNMLMHELFPITGFIPQVTPKPLTPVSHLGLHFFLLHGV